MTGFSNPSNSPSSLIIPGQGYVPSIYGPATANTRRNVMALGGEGDLGTAAPLNGDVCQRYGFTIPSTGGAPITRFRFRLRNSNLKANTNQSGNVTLGAFAIGIPNTPEAAWAGDFTTAPTTVLAAPGAVNVGTVEYVSPWISPSTFTLTPNKFYGLTYGLTTGGTSLNFSYTPGWSWAGTGSAAAALAAAAPGTTAQPFLQYLDLRMEYEFAGTAQLGFIIGASFESGYLNTLTTPIAAVGHMGPDNTWSQQAGLRLGHHMMNGGVGGSTATAAAGSPAFASTANLAWTRFFSPESGNATYASTPDYAVISLVTNDAGAATTQPTLAQYQTAILGIITNLQALGIQRIYLCTNPAGYTVSILNVVPTFMSGRLSTQLPVGGFASIALNDPNALATPQTSGFGIYGGPPGAPGNWWNAGGGPWNCYIGLPVVGGQGYSGAGAFIPPIGPITITAAAAAGGVLTLTAAGTILTATQTVGSPVLTGAEFLRQQFNQWIRSLPPGVQSVIDFAADTDSPFYYPSTLPRPDFYNNSGDAHPTNNGMYTLWASRFVNGILGN